MAMASFCFFCLRKPHNSLRTVIVVNITVDGRIRDSLLRFMRERGHARIRRDILSTVSSNSVLILF